MYNWNKLMENQVFISDLGSNQEAVVEGQAVLLGRYAVWSPVTNSKGHQVIEVGDDLQDLCKKYHVPQERICTILTEEER
ncbi:MAG: hypothetical protein FIA99_16685 [Ruminiclostridium sp.]|nr:hypothetical protein [Ruminiclostridium sp.]